MLGVEAIQEWCEKISELHIDGIEMVNSDIESYLNSSHFRSPETTLVYLYLSSISDELAVKVGNICRNFSGVHILTVSFSFEEYGFSDIEVLKSCSISFPWGTTDVYYQRVR